MHEGKLKELYERLLECTWIVTCEIEVRNHQVHVVETGDGPPLGLLHGTSKRPIISSGMADKLLLKI
jgi:hypothetical protein